MDDGSGEEYQQVFDKIRDICIVLCHGENCGKGAAIKTALSYIKWEIWENELTGIMDCDGQHLPEDMMKLFQFARTHKKTLVLGVRTVGKEMPFKSRAGNNHYDSGILDLYSNNRHRDNGTIIRNGVVYRNMPTDVETCVLNWDGKGI